MAQRNSDANSESTWDGVPFAPTRRTVLKSAAATGVAASFTTIGTAQEGETFELDGFSEGWVGQAPDEIAEEENPTLQLEVGQTYVVEWTNADGTPHDFVILNAEGDAIDGTEIVTEQGEVVTFEFEATEEMAEYYCSVHPAEMRGDIELADVEEPTPDEEPDDELLIEKGPTVGLETVAEGLDSPIDFQVANEEADRRFIVDQPGQIYVHGPDGLEDEPFLDIADRVSIDVDDFDERGLLGLAFHPDFQENGRFYVRYSGYRGTVTPASYSHTFVVSEFQTGDDLETADPDSERRLMEVPQPQFNHNAGPLAFGPDGYLYVAIGDGGDGDDTGPGHPEDWYTENEGGSGQNTRDTLLGGMLRIDVNTEEFDKPYGIPEDNPLYEMDLEETEDEEPEEEEGVDEEVDEADAELEDDDDELEDNGNGLEDEDDEEIEVDENGREDEVQEETTDEEVEVDENGREEEVEEDDEEVEDEPELTGEPGHAEYYAWGMRNPWGMSFTDDGELLAADVGQLLFEIINHVERGGNYGWNVKEGVHCFSTDNPGEPPEECPDETPEDVRGGEPLLDPVIDYPQEYDIQNIGSAVVGGRMYTEGGLEDLQDGYIFGDWSESFEEPLGKLFVSHPPDGWQDGDRPTDAGAESFADQVPEGTDHPLYEEELWEDLWPVEQLRIDADDDLVREEDELDRFVLAFGQDAEGEIYVLTTEENFPSGGTGEVHRLVPADEDPAEPVDEAPDDEMDPDDEPEAPDDEDPVDEPEAPEEDPETGA
ncbi:PQQ-dependent sugar dehydrogenase [Halostagnicola bangensis]